MSYKPGSVAVVGAAETTRLGVVPDMSQMMLHADAAMNAMADAGIGPGDIDGFACVGQMLPHQVAHYLGITPKWIDGTGVGGCSFMLHVRHAAAAIQAGYAKTILITHGESGRSRINATPVPPQPESLAGQFEVPYGPNGYVTLFTLPFLRYMKETGTTQEHLAKVSVVQREWASRNPRAMYKDPLTIEDVLSSRLIAYPFHMLQCCLVTDGGGAIILSAAERTSEFASKPVYILGSGESSETMMVSQMKDFTFSNAFHRSGKAAFEMAGIDCDDVDHLMIYDAFAHLPLYGLEALGFCKVGEAKDFIWENITAPGGRLPLNTNGGGLSYTHTGMYGMFAMQESIRQVRGCAAAQVDGVSISVSHGAGGMFCTAGTIVFGRDVP